MSIEKTPHGEYRVRWRAGGRERSKVTGPRKQDAIAFEDEVRRTKRLGLIVPDEIGKARVSDFGAKFDDRHIARKAPKTQVLYRYLWDKHILPTFGPGTLREITVGGVEDWLTALERKGVGREAQRKSLGLLVLALNKAIAWGELQTNPAAAVAKPKHRPKPVTPPTPLEVERIREALIERKRVGDAVLVSVLAYAGLRPQEALSLVWRDIGDRTILVGSEHKTGSRSVRILAPLARDLAEWKLACGGKHELVFPNTRGNQWSESGWSNWRRRVWRPLIQELRSQRGATRTINQKQHASVSDNPQPSDVRAEEQETLGGESGVPAAAIGDISPYSLRHTFISLLIREGLPVTEVAAQAGHSPQVCLNTYAHLFHELGGTGSAEDAIRAARSEVAAKKEAM